MRGSERALFIGNMICLCAATPDTEVCWQPKRIVITDQHIYYFAHTQFNLKQQSIPHWATFKPTNLTISQMQERQQKNVKVDIDSITQPPLLEQSISDRQAFLMSFDQLLGMLNKNGIPPPPQQSGRVVCLTNKGSKEVQYMIAVDTKDATLFYRAVAVGNAFTKYYSYCATKNMPANQSIIAWLQECINEQVTKLSITNENMIDTYRFIAESTNVINGYIFELSLLQHQKALQMLLQAIKSDHLIHLQLKGCHLNATIINDIQHQLQACQYLELLDFSNNDIDDRGIDIMARLFEHCFEIKIVDLSTNQISGNDLHFEVFILKASQWLSRLQLNLSHNHLQDQSIPVFENRLLSDESCTMSQLNISYNKFSRNGIAKLFTSYTRDRKAKQLQMKLFPLPFSPDVLTQLFTTCTMPEEQGNKKTTSSHASSQIIRNTVDQLHLTIQRKESSKLPVVSAYSLQQIRVKEQFIRKTFEEHQDDPPIEVVYTICQQIEEFPFQMPSKLILKLQEWIWHKLNEAILIRDHYAISFLTFAAYYVGMDNTLFKDRYLKLARRMQIIEDRINRLLNFKVPEQDMNEELDDLIAECHRLDMRGQPLDYLIYLKLEREQYIRQYLVEDYEWHSEVQVDATTDPFYFLQRDLDKINIEIPDQLAKLGINVYLYQHPTEINYYELTQINLITYEEYSESIQKVLIYQQTLLDKNLISKFTLDDFKLEDQERVNYLAKQCYNRVKFITYNHFLEFDPKLWVQLDIQLNHIRLLLNYYSWNVRKLQMRQKFEKLNTMYQEMVFDEILNDIDQQQTHEEYRFIISDISIRIMEQDIKFSGIVPLQSTIIDYPFNLNSSKSSMLDIDNEIYQYAVSEIQRSFKVTLYDIIASNQKNFNGLMIFQSMRHIIDICTRSPFPSLLGDELYLLIYHTIKLNTLEDIQFYQILSTFLLYIPPSTQMISVLKNWVQTVEPLQLRIQSILNSWVEGKLMPYWLPSIYELEHRITCTQLINIRIYTLTQDVISVQISEFDTVGILMSQVGKYPKYDQFSNWIYYRVEVELIGNVSHHQDIPLLTEMRLLEAISLLSLKYTSLNNKLIIKRRIFNARYTILYDELIHHQATYFEQLRDQFINRQFLCSFYTLQSVVQLAAILYVLDTKLQCQEQALRVMKYKKVQSQQELKDKIISETNSVLKDNAFIKYIPKCLNVGDITEYISQAIQQVIQLNPTQLQELFTSIMISNPAAHSSNFVVNYNGLQNLHMIVNNFYIGIYEKDVQLLCIMYQDVVGIAISAKQMRIHLYNEKIDKIVIGFLHEKTLECYQDILSYLLLRSKEPLDCLYSYNELYRMIYKDKICLITDVNQNNIVAKLIKITEESQDGYYAKLQQQNSSQFNQEKYLATLWNKQLRLQYIMQNTPNNELTEMNFPFHHKCPILNILKPHIQQAKDISHFFGKNSKNEVHLLFEPYIEQFSGVAFLPMSSNNTSIVKTPRSITLKSQSRSHQSSNRPSLKSPSFTQRSEQQQHVSSNRNNMAGDWKHEDEQSVKSEVIESSARVTDKSPKTERSKQDDLKLFEYSYPIEEVSEEMNEEYTLDKKDNQQSDQQQNNVANEKLFRTYQSDDQQQLEFSNSSLNQSRFKPKVIDSQEDYQRQYLEMRKITKDASFRLELSSVSSLYQSQNVTNKQDQHQQPMPEQPSMISVTQQSKPQAILLMQSFQEQQNDESSYHSLYESQGKLNLSTDQIIGVKQGSQNEINSKAMRLTQMSKDSVMSSIRGSIQSSGPQFQQDTQQIIRQIIESPKVSIPPPPEQPQQQSLGSAISNALSKFPGKKKN